MQELTGDMFNPNSYSLIHEGGLVTPPPFEVPDAICITTNGFVKKNGEAVMGRGCARRAAQLMPGLPEILGNYLIHGQNIPLAHGPWNGMEIVTFPVKPKNDRCKADKSNVVKHMKKQFKAGDIVPGWACVACPLIIEASAHDLVSMTNQRNWDTVVLPRPGCGAGELEWPLVKHILEKHLDDRFYAITFV